MIYSKLYLFQVMQKLAVSKFNLKSLELYLRKFFYQTNENCYSSLNNKKLLHKRTLSIHFQIFLFCKLIFALDLIKQAILI